MRPVIVFDYDGTLVDAYGVKRESYWRAVSEVLGLQAAHRPIVEASYARTSGAHRFEQLADTAAALGRPVSEADREEFSRRYSAYNEAAQDQMPEFPSARAVLEALRARYDLVLTSGLPHADLVADATRRSLAAFFAVIEGGDKGRTLDRLLREGRQVVLFVGDTPHDERVAAARGIPFHRVGGDMDLLGVLQAVPSAS
ncbi:MAG: HAD hydrolase-like protein [Armatimonadota bacterium]|nr:HAD hydrolase-like protein [Armatimonadota bacterium]MDR7518986.1 HAD hydrolase-like protein [Armatimonadota bacterium]MDR7548895.1 HAD hydrolase-like protein [Armatimonadota bacterium]